jgi:hypothetical protein
LYLGQDIVWVFLYIIARESEAEGHSQRVVVLACAVRVQHVNVGNILCKAYR